MKKGYLLLVFIALIGGVANAQTSDNNNAINDKQLTEEYELTEATAICMDAIYSPTKYNEYIKPFINSNSFPQKTMSVSKEDFKKLVFAYLKKQPVVVKNILSERKKAHKKLYGTRP